MLRLLALNCTLLFGACSALPSDTPPGDYGRPAVVRGAATTGACVGGIIGVVPWLIFYPVNKALNALFDEPLGYSEREWNMLPITLFAAGGHHLLGAPADALHFAFYRAWVEDPPTVGFDHTPTADPIGDGVRGGENRDD